MQGWSAGLLRVVIELPLVASLVELCATNCTGSTQALVRELLRLQALRLEASLTAVLESSAEAGGVATGGTVTGGTAPAKTGGIATGGTAASNGGDRGWDW